jgi:hypothetical protein
VILLFILRLEVLHSDHDVCVVSACGGLHAIADLYTRQFTAGASGVGAQSYSFAVVPGYLGTPERIVALERAELIEACGVSLTLFHPQFGRLVSQGRIRLIAQGALQKDRRYPQLPNIFDQAKTPDVREALEFLYLPLALGRSLVASAGIPEDRLDVLRWATAEPCRMPISATTPKTQY